MIAGDNTKLTLISPIFCIILHVNKDFYSGRFKR
jgi:hypothetical protein